jgi:hypothetical protein
MGTIQARGHRALGNVEHLGNFPLPKPLDIDEP